MKVLLPACLEQGLEPEERIRVERHLEICEDCRSELAMLRTMREEQVPDPGDAFWTEMPARVYRDYQREKRLDRAGLWEWLLMPRWVWAAVAAGIVFAASWLVFHPRIPVQKETAAAFAPVEEYSYDDPAAAGSADLTDLNQPELESVDGWADNQFAEIGHEIAAAGYRVSAADTDIDEELAGLNSREMEQLSKMLEAWNEEG